VTLLEVSNVNAFYGDFHALFDVSLRAESAEALAIIGANGAGKSTLLNAIAGNVATKGGSIRFAGGLLNGLKPWKIVTRGVTLVPEGRRLFTSLTVEENLQMGAYAREGRDWTLSQVYELFPRLKERAKQAVTSLSGGEQQMVAIGRALMSNPELLMCDELSLGLAPVVVQDIYATLRKVRDSGVTVVVVEQNVQQALAFADRVYCLQEGHVTLEGATKELSAEDVSRAYFGKKGAA
jgi:branched-chain amino acid transport system ATP-binding protein